MAKYCFAERQRELFIESVTRGWLAAILDFPHFKSPEQAQAAAQRVPASLRDEVCCIGEDDYPYRHLIVHAWVLSYLGIGGRGSERLNAQAAFHLKQVPEDEALERTRHGMTVEREAQEEISRLWTYYTGLTPLQCSQ